MIKFFLIEALTLELLSTDLPYTYLHMYVLG